MSDQRNGDPGPKALKEAFRIISGKARQFRKTIRKSMRAGLQKLPRRFCAVCLVAFDEALISPDYQIESAICSRCKAHLAEGYTALISDTLTEHHFAMVKSPKLEAEGLRGKIVPMTMECFRKVQERYEPKHLP